MTQPLFKQPQTKDVVIACADNMQFMRGLPSESMKLIVTSPPYNFGKSYERRDSIDAYLAGQEAVIAACAQTCNYTSPR